MNDAPAGPIDDGSRAVASPCCALKRTPAAASAAADAAADAAARTGSPRSAHTVGLLALSGGTFLMGTDDPDGVPEDMEGPARPVRVDSFEIAATPVTNREFARFVESTGCRTDAERFGWSFVFHLLLVPAARQHVLDAAVPQAAWWLAVQGADWTAPDGPGSTVQGREQHPVVHVSYRDAQAYCEWSGTRLATEAEWEYAARGGLPQARFAWGDELTPDGQHRCNIWQGTFPTVNSADDGFVGTSPVTAFPPNGFGLYDVAGNVWEITAEPWRDPWGRTLPGERVIRGGSYLCHDSYCNRYRVAARSRTTEDSSSGNTGFRVAR
ncbi:formylglycine-generating enzyme family protein [Micromonospora sp. NRRL B-16802]|uniref:formylglycine-generating enzyme family protein n=1 Tax=Micromonospora sp. NRRL B-16802 TaxID=1415541 RepID=UPI0006AED03B|nr:formylglycine-generating enzyme family protein [Micromonospora sp. NRRL B-16802]